MSVSAVSPGSVPAIRPSTAGPAPAKAPVKAAPAPVPAARADSDGDHDGTTGRISVKA